MDRPVTPLCFLCALAIFAFAPRATSAPARFTLDEGQSRITISGNIMGLALREQGPGSMTTTFGGTIVTDLGDTSVQFTGGSVLEAKTHGDWRPNVGGGSGSAPANFAAEASTLLGTVRGALRNVVLDVTSAALPITGGQFDASNLVFAFPQGSKAAFDYNAGLLGSDSVVLSGLSTNKIVNGATVSGAAGSRTLTIQVDTEFVFELLSEGDSLVKLAGALVAVEAAQDQPSIRSIEVKDGTVILRVEGAGAEPRLDGSADLRQWTAQNPSRATDGNTVVLTLPATAAQQFYRVAK